MIARYSKPEMTRIWTDHHKYEVWLQVEMAVCQEMHRQGLIPDLDWKDLQQRVQFLQQQGGLNPQVVDAHERITHHDVIAFTTAVADVIGASSRWIHFGLTSSDVVDTATSLLLQEAGAILNRDIQQLLIVLKAKAEQYRLLPTIGRSHGMFAEPTCFGLKFLGWHAEWQRNQERLQRALEQLRVGKLSGAVGVNAHWNVPSEQRVLASLNLKRETVSTQVIPRDRHAELLNTLALLGTSLERIALELRHLQRSEVREVREGFKKGQKGSSAMPHKRNPISTENLTGCARLLRSYAQAALEDVALWHERDISHSSVERVILPDATLVLDYALQRMTQVLQNLVVDEQRVTENLTSAGKLVFSGHFLLELVKLGAAREQAYEWVQSCALEALEKNQDFLKKLSEHSEIQKILSAARIQELGSIQYQLRNVDEIYREVSLIHGGSPS